MYPQTEGFFTHWCVCVCTPKRSNSIPVLGLCGLPDHTLGRGPILFFELHKKCPLHRGLCACFVVYRITRSLPTCAWPGASRAGRARDRGLNCPSWCVEGFRIGVSRGDLSGRGRTVGLRSRSLDLRSRPLCAEPRLRELCITQAMEDGAGGVYKRCTRLSDDRCSHSRRRLRPWLQRTSLSWSLGP